MKKTFLLVLLIMTALSICTFQYACAEEGDLAITSFSAYLADEDGREIYSVNADERHQIASMVKIMTADLVFESIESGELSVDEKVTVSAEAAGMGGSQMFLDAGTEYSVSDLLKGVIVASANDASYALAERISGSASAFVADMNEKAALLGLRNTLFANCTGLPGDSEQYSSARDVNIMTRELMKHDLYFDYAGIWTEDYVHPSGRITTLTNTNKLIRQYTGCKGGKTGFTEDAGFCLSACAERGGIEVIATVIGAADGKTRFAECCRLFNHAFANLTRQVALEKGEEADATVEVKGGKIKSVVPVASKQAAITVMRGEKASVEYQIFEVKAPLKAGDVVGKIILSNGDKREEFDLVSPVDIQKATLWDRIKDMMS